MDFEKLNMRAAEYQAAGTNATFSELYREAITLFRRMNRTRVVLSRLGDENDADELLDEVILKVIAKSPNNFGSAMLISLKNAQLDFFKIERRRRNRYELSVDTDSPNSDIEDKDSSAETIAIRGERKKEAGQLQLIDFICDPRQVDSDTLTYVSMLRQTDAKGKPRYESITALAKALGLHPETIRRKLHRLSRRYDANHFDVVSLMPEGLRVRQEFLTA